jgi:D-3-phosphoglycerate dehydrogenase
VRPGIPLAEKLGRIFTGLAGGVACQLDVEVRGEIAREDVKILELAALKGVFTDVVPESVSYVNAPVIAADRDVEVRLITDEESPDYRNIVTVRGTLPDGRVHSVSGTLVGPRHGEKLVEVDGYDIEVPPTEHMVFLRYADRPGIVGIVGRILGEAAVNIGGMQVSRDAKGGEALVGMTVDSAVPGEVLDRIVAEIGARHARAIDLVDAPSL